MNVLAIWVLAAATTGTGLDANTLQLRPKFVVGQELSFSGTVVETILGTQGLKYEQPYTLECTALVLEVDPNRVAKLGCLTVIKMPGHQGNSENSKLDHVESVHLDMVTVSPTGKATWAPSGAEIILPQGVATWELGFLLEMPSAPVSPGHRWTIQPTGQPHIVCKFEQVEMVAGVRCARIQCVQESQNWDSESIGQDAWKNETTLWWDLETGVMNKMQRVYHVRDANDPEAVETYVTKLEEAGNLRYRGPILQERSNDFKAAFEAQTKFERVSSMAAAQASRELARLKEQLKVDMDKLYSSPYRPIMQHLMDQIEYAMKNPGEPAPATIIGRNNAKIGKPARNFVMRDIKDNSQISLKKLKNQPVVIVLVNPSSLLSLQALAVAVKAVDGSTAKLYAVCTEASDGIEQRIHTIVPGEYTVCTGGGFDRAYGAESTPHTIFIDGNGILRANFSGLGPEMYVALGRELGIHAPTHQAAQKGTSTLR